MLWGLTINLIIVFLDSKNLSLCHGKPQKREKMTTLQANIEFRASLPNSINVIMYMEFDDNIFVDKTHHEKLLKMDSSHLRCIF